MRPWRREVPAQGHVSHGSSEEVRVFGRVKLPWASRFLQKKRFSSFRLIASAFTYLLGLILVGLCFAHHACMSGRCERCCADLVFIAFGDEGCPTQRVLLPPEPAHLGDSPGNPRPLSVRARLGAPGWVQASLTSGLTTACSVRIKWISKYQLVCFVL